MRRKISLIIIGIVVLLCALVAWKWNSWFGETPELPYQVSALPHGIVLTLGDDASSMRNISWQCDTVVRNAQVILISSIDTVCIAAKGEIVTSTGGKAAYYQAHLKSLTPDTYSYRVMCDSLSSASYSFTIPTPSDTLSFLLIGDVQDTPPFATGAIFDTLYQKYPEAAFWGFSGDVIERPTDMYRQEFFNAMRRVSPSIPMVVATGNHDYHKGLFKKLDARWLHTFVNPIDNSPDGFEGRSYICRFGVLTLVVIDTDGLQLPTHYLDHRRWIQEQLEKDPAPYKIVMMHHPIHSVRKSRNNYAIQLCFESLFEDLGVNFVFQGHDHAYARGQASPKAPLYMVSSCSPKFYKVGKSSFYDVVTPNVQYYNWVTITQSDMCIVVYDFNHQLIESIHLGLE